MSIDRSNSSSTGCFIPRSRHRGGIFQGLIRAIRTVITHPLTSAAYFLALPGLGMAMNSKRSLNDTNALQPNGTCAPNITTNLTNTEQAQIEFDDIPVDIDAILAAAGYAQDNNETVDLAWFFYDEVCQQEVNDMIFEDQAQAQQATIWQAEIEGSIHAQTRLTAEQAVRAVSVVAQDHISEEQCVEDLYLDPFATSEVRVRLNARETLLSAIRNPNEESTTRRRLPRSQIQGRNAQGQAVFNAHIEEILTQVSGASNRVRRDAVTQPTSSQETQLRQDIEATRAELCPDGISILHGNTTTNQAQLTQLQAKITALCPNLSITAHSSLNTRLPSAHLGATQLLEQLTDHLHLNSTNDILILSTPNLEGVQQNIQALEQAIEALENADISIFSADDESWVKEIPGVYSGGSAAEKLVRKQVKRIAKRHIKANKPNEDKSSSSTAFILVIFGIALVFGAATMVYLRKRTQQAEANATQAQSFEMQDLTEVTESLIQEQPQRTRRRRAPRVSFSNLQQQLRRPIFSASICISNNSEAENEQASTPAGAEFISSNELSSQIPIGFDENGEAIFEK